MSVSYNYEGKIAVVTGGSAGIGEAIKNHLIRAGATVVVWDLNTKENPDDAEYLQVDVTDRINVLTATQSVIDKHGRIDMLINSAGYAGPTMPVDQYDPDEWKRIIDINLVGVFETCRNVLKHMRNSEYGRIVNISSLAGKEGTPNASAYSAAKAGVIALTKSMGKEFADYDIRINSVAPAAVKTAILEQMSPEHVQTMINKSPQQRLGTVDEVAEIVMWLCSDECSFNSGAVFDLSGGRATY
ncbi:SDR family oxidoreductase [Emcibacteraceae bacterium Y4]|nr:SDR family oxidoreductase [Pseudemcibacter aquimaris]MCC3862426.1 SDR family oxidoreductase [Pseudemcibacter aquimaris]WDU59144.1 SDR family oxidoreductase [Pseudemcibacter aquimaris]